MTHRIELWPEQFLYWLRYFVALGTAQEIDGELTEVLMDSDGGERDGVLNAKIVKQVLGRKVEQMKKGLQAPVSRKSVA